MRCKSGKKPTDIPSACWSVYKSKGWVNVGDWLGTGYVPPRLRKFLPFAQARTFAQSLNLKSETKWREYAKSGKKPNNIPSTPHTYYKDNGWKNWGDWLGTGNVHEKQFRAFTLARAFVRSLGLRDLKAWQTYSRSGERPDDIPSNPAKTYESDGWVGYGDWLQSR